MFLKIQKKTHFSEIEITFKSCSKRFMPKLKKKKEEKSFSINIRIIIKNTKNSSCKIKIPKKKRKID